MTETIVDILGLIGALSIFTALIILGPNHKISKLLFLIGVGMASVFYVVRQQESFVGILIYWIIMGATYFVIYHIYGRRKAKDTK